MALVQGFKPGWNQPGHMNIFKNSKLAVDSSIRRYRAYSTSKKFLLYGEMLRPPVLLSPAKRIKFKWWRAWSKATYDADVPMVMSSLWKAADETFGLVLYNVSAKAQSVKIKLTDKSLKVLSKVKTKSVWPKNLKIKYDKKSGYIVISCVVPPQSPAVIEIRK